MWSGPDERNLAKLRVANIIIPMFNLSNSEMTSFGKWIVCLVLGLIGISIVEVSITTQTL